MEEYNKVKHGSYREYQKIKIKESSDKIQADKQVKYDKKAKAKSIADAKNQESKKNVEITKKAKKEIKKDKSTSKEVTKKSLNTLNKAKKLFKKERTTKNKELYSLRYKEAKLKHDTNLEYGKIRMGLASDGSELRDEVDTSLDPTGMTLNQTPITFKSTFASKNPITKIYSK
tara:strand:- start:192 stop:710 length:519 start_codon:yes stop_codon:yes gene_type:complete